MDAISRLLQGAGKDAVDAKFELISPHLLLVLTEITAGPSGRAV
jgi:hypothetical protein